MKKTLKNNLTCFVSALTAGAFFLFVCFYFKVFPFGTEYTVLKIDLAQQYAPMLTQLYDLIKSGNGIFYSWSSGLGYSFLGNYLNYLASPFTYIIFFFSRENIVNAVNVIILLKTMLIAGCFSYYLKKSYSFKGAFNLIPSLLFTFSGWFVAYHWNIMWLDAVFCLPLAALGIQRIIKEKKPFTYFFTLSYAMLTNYYMAYILCLFFCVYFIYYYIQNNEVKKDFSSGLLKSNFFKSGVMFAAFSVFSACASAVALLPVYFLLRNSSATGDTFSRGIQFYFNFFTFWAQQFSGNSIIVQTGGEPNVPNAWCGMMTIILMPVYFLSKAFPKKERACDFALAAFMVFSLSFNAISYVWHGFHFANGLEDRFAFLYVFVAVTVTAKALNKAAEINRKSVIAFAVISIAYITVMHLTGSEYAGKAALIISIGFTVLWLAVYLLKGIKKLDRDLIKIIAVFVVCLEIAFSQLEDLDFNFYRGDYDKNSTKFSGIYSTLSNSDSELFFRTEATSIQNRMYPMVMGYNGVTNFSSMTSYAVAKSQFALGIEGNNMNLFSYYPQSPVYNAVFGIKYLIGETGSLDENDYFSEIVADEGFCAYKNNYYLPLGFCIEKSAASYENGTGNNPFYQQNLLFNRMCSAGDVFEQVAEDKISCEDLKLHEEKQDSGCWTKVLSAETDVSAESGFISYTFSLESDKDYYVFVTYKRCETGAKLDISGSEIEYTKGISNYVIDPRAVIPLGVMDENETLTVRLPVNNKTQGKPISVYVASFNKEKFIEGYNRLSQHTLNLTEFDNMHFKGTVTADEDCLLFTSIPYDKGWRITLDGRAVDEKDVVAIDNAYISVPLTKGKHTVEFDYFPQGLKAGVAISAVSVCGLITYLFFEKKRKKSINNQSKTDS